MADCHLDLLDDYFALPLTVIRRKIDGLRDSLVTSSVWRPEFKRPLEKRPNLEILELDFAIPTCDACHLGGRMSTRLGRVSGELYDRLTFQVTAIHASKVLLQRLSHRILQPLSDSDSERDMTSEDSDSRPKSRTRRQNGRSRDNNPRVVPNVCIRHRATDGSSQRSRRESSDEGTSEGEDRSVQEFHLGRFCAARTQVFHKFMHWEVRQA